MKKQASMENLHERARRLIDQERVEGLAAAESHWLQDHLAACEGCAARAAETEAAILGLKSLSVRVPPGLAVSTNRLVREEATKLKQRRARNLALILGCTISWVAGVASAPLVWRLCEWFGTTLDLPRIVWELGFLSWWLVPAASAGIVILWVTERAQREEINGRLEKGLRSKQL